MPDQIKSGMDVTHLMNIKSGDDVTDLMNQSDDFPIDPSKLIVGSSTNPGKSVIDKGFDLGKQVVANPIVNRGLFGITPENTPGMDPAVYNMKGPGFMEIPGVGKGADWLANKVDNPLGEGGYWPGLVAGSIQGLGGLLSAGADPRAVAIKEAPGINEVIPSLTKEQLAARLNPTKEPVFEGLRNNGRMVRQGKFTQEPDGSYLDVFTGKKYDAEGKLFKPGKTKVVKTKDNALVDPKTGEEIPITGPTPYTPADYATDNAFMKARGQAVPKELEELAKPLAPNPEVIPKFTPKGKAQEPLTTQQKLNNLLSELAKSEEGSLDIGELIQGTKKYFGYEESYDNTVRSSLVKAINAGRGVDLDRLYNSVGGDRKQFDKIIEKVIETKRPVKGFNTLDEVRANINNQKDWSPEKKASVLAQVDANEIKANGRIPNNPSLLAKTNSFAKSMLTAVDISAPGRQGLPFWYTKEFWTSFDDMFKSWGSDKAYHAIKQGIMDDPLFRVKYNSVGEKIPSIAERAGLELPDIIEGREERFASGLAEKFPGVRASERAYTAFLNKLRADRFKTLYKAAEAAGHDMGDLEFLQNMADTINVSTGRGDPKIFGAANQFLQKHLFAPNYLASRFQILNPGRFLDPRLDPMVRKENLKNVLGLISASAALNTMYSTMGGEVGTDITSTDFAKAKFDKTRMDPNAGVQQPLVLGARMVSELADMYVNGRQKDYGKFGINTPLDIATNFGLNKFNPVESFIIAALRGTDFDSKPFEVKRALINRMTPIMLQDIYQIYTENPELFPLVIPAAMGQGMLTYSR